MAESPEALEAVLVELGQLVRNDADALAPVELQGRAEAAVAEALARLIGDVQSIPTSAAGEVCPQRPILARDLLITTDLVSRAAAGTF